MRADADLAAVGRDGEDVRGAAQGGDGNPAGVGAEGYILQMRRQLINVSSKGNLNRFQTKEEYSNTVETGYRVTCL